MAARYIDLHALQEIPASVLNRGEDNEPKTLKFGNTTRTMVSSQCWKRHIRLDVEELLDEPAARTRMLPLRVADALRSAGWPQCLATFAGAQVVRSATRKGLSTDPQQNGLTLATLFVPRSIIDELAALCHQHRPALEEALTQQGTTTRTPGAKSGRKKKEDTDDDTGLLPTRQIAELLSRRTASINLFGRMLAEIPDAHVDGAVQMAHAFSVNTSNPQPDFFVSVEDWPTPGEAGTAHLQTAFFSTGVLYRYATVNLTELTHNLEGDHDQALQLLALFTESFIMTIPGAKKTSTAPHTLPSLVHYAVRDRRPVSYAGAFEQPVAAQPGGGHSRPAQQVFADHAAALNRLIGTRRRIAHGHATLHGTTIDPLGTHHPSFDDLIDACTTAAAATCTTSPVAA